MKNNQVDEAISLAIAGRWEDAVAVNQAIIEMSPYDADAHNRLGKALAGLGHYEEARAAYGRALELDSANIVARKNIERLANLKNEERPIKESPKIDSDFFIEETGKARIVSLHRVSPRETLAKMSAGDKACLQVMEYSLVVVNCMGEYLGEIEPRIASRLIEMMEAGNEYQAAIVSNKDDRVKVIIRETYRHPSQEGRLSFPPMAMEEPRAYLKNTMLKYDLDEDFPQEPDEPGDLEGETEPLWDEDSDAADDDDQMDID